MVLVTNLFIGRNIMSFGTIIKKLRLEKNMTQEQLAEVLSISGQAVSRWETNVALPDISLLPVLAHFFDVTTDYLLEVDITKKEKEIEDWLEKARAYTTKGYWGKGIEILREAIKKYPSSCLLINELAYALYCSPQEMEQILEGENNLLLEEIVSLEQYVLEHSKDNALTYSATWLLCQVYVQLGQIDKAEALANTMPSMNQCKEEILCLLYQGTKRFKQVQDTILLHLELLLSKLTHNSAPLDDNTRPYTTEEQILLNKKVIDILDILFEDKNYGFFGQTIAWTYLNIAWFYAKLKNQEETIKYLVLAKEQAIVNDKNPYNPNNQYSCLVFRGKEYGEIWNNITLNDSMHQIEEMNDMIYDFIREKEEFQKIKNELYQYANRITGQSDIHMDKRYNIS